MDFGLICEGPTDRAALENILCGIYDNEDLFDSINPLQPGGESDTNKEGGWERVLQYIANYKFREAFLMLDYVIIQIDTDVANMNVMIDCASTTDIMRQDCVKSILARTHPEVHAEYESYNWQVWGMSTGREHYGDMNPGSRDTSTKSTVCRDGESQMDIIRVYYTRFEESPRFVIKAWNGTATI